MTDKNWSQIGDEIEDMVRKALESRDFGKTEPGSFPDRGRGHGKCGEKCSGRRK